MGRVTSVLALLALGAAVAPGVSEQQARNSGKKKRKRYFTIPSATQSAAKVNASAKLQWKQEASWPQGPHANVWDFTPAVVDD